MMRGVLILAVAVLVPSCPPPSPSPPPDHYVAPPLPPANCGACSNACECACCSLARLGCREALPTPKGERCEQVCVDSARVPGLELPALCVQKASSVEAVRACGVRCQGGN